MSILLIMFFAVLFFSVVGILLLIYIQWEPANLVVFVIFSVFTLLVNAMFISSLSQNESHMLTAAYICGAIAILAVIARFSFPQSETFSKILVILSLVGAIIGTFFL